MKTTILYLSMLNLSLKCDLQGPFRTSDEVWQQRHKPLKPTLRVATSYEAAEDSRWVQTTDIVIIEDYIWQNANLILSRVLCPLQLAFLYTMIPVNFYSLVRTPKSLRAVGFSGALVQSGRQNQNNNESETNLSYDLYLVSFAEKTNNTFVNDMM